MASQKRFFLLALLTVFCLSLFLFAASAHEGREVGEYELVFGWRVEPALAGYPNGPEVIIRAHEADEHGHDDASEEHAHDENPLADVAISLQVEVSFGPASRVLDMRPVFGEPGRYVADLIPTRPGDYTFRVFGTIGENPVDETFTSAAGEFSSVEPAGDVTFPDELPSMVDLLDRIGALEARIAALEGSG